MYYLSAGRKPPTSSRLKRKTEDTAAHEDKGMRSRSNSTDSLSIHNQISPKTQIYHSRYEHRAESKADQVPQEIVSHKWIAIQEHSSDIS